MFTMTHIPSRFLFFTGSMLHAFRATTERYFLAAG
jgi:hypothetical protein